MAHFTRTRANLAAWATGTTVQNTEYDDLDEKTFKAINGDDGGTWAPSAVITIGGSGLTMTGPFTAADATISTDLHGNWTCDGNVTFSNALHVTGDAYLANGASLTGVSGCSLTGYFGGTPFFQGTPTVDGSSAKLVFSSGADCDLGDGTNISTLSVKDHSAISAESGASVVFASGSLFTMAGSQGVAGKLYAVSGGEIEAQPGSTVDVQSGVTFTLASPIVCSGTGRIQQRVITSGVDADTTFAIADGDVIYVRSGALTNNRAYTLSTAGASTGDRLSLFMGDATYQVTVLGQVFKNASGQAYSATFMYDATLGSWFNVERHYYP
jgi:hypothetical protein